MCTREHIPLAGKSNQSMAIAITPDKVDLLVLYAVLSRIKIWLTGLTCHRSSIKISLPDKGRGKQGIA